MNPLWLQCTDRLEQELPEQEINTWIRPLQVKNDRECLRLLAPNRFVLDWVQEHYLLRIKELVGELTSDPNHCLRIEVGDLPDTTGQNKNNPPFGNNKTEVISAASQRFTNHLTVGYTFDNFIQGKSNQLARAAALQIAEQPGIAYNPMFIYGGVGLGKTHLMQAIGNQIILNKPNAKVVYLHSERFVADMIKALQNNMINQFKGHYRSLDALLIDDIQFFAGKERSQEEFFHTFNALLEGGQQIILTSDRYPKEVKGLEDRLKSRFGWGLTVSIDHPNLKRVLLLSTKKQSRAGLHCLQKSPFLSPRKFVPTFVS